MKTITFLSQAVAAIRFKTCSLILLIIILSTVGASAQENLLRRKVTINSNEKPLEKVLLEISDLAQFTFSYDASILASNQKISVSSKDESVKSALDQILPEDINYKVSGNHLILLRKSQDHQSGKKEKFTISGKVYDAYNAGALPNVVVYEVSSLKSALTNDKGEFTIEVPSQFEQVGLSFNKRAYRDSIIFLPLKDQRITISLNRESQFLPADRIQNLSINHQAPPVESLPFVQQIVPGQSLVRTRNMDMIRKRVAQVSVLPLVGTNLKMSGLMRNNFSLNIFMGYSYGVDALEVGGFFNIVRKDVNGVQIGGLGNFVGQDTKGFQAGGLINHNRGTLKGVQVGGLHNMLVDTLMGVQIAGINNILDGGMKGWQIAGVNNFTTRNVDGVQIAGLTNLAADDVRMLQIAGLINFCENVRGMQLSGLFNIAKKDVKGFQLAGIANWGRNVNAVQFGGIANFSTDTVSGAQLSGIFNYARYTKSSQISLFNIADSASGTPVGFISFVRKGYHTPEISTNEILPVNIAFKTGVKRFYNIFSAGAGNWHGEEQWAFGYGFGAEKKIGKRTSLSVEYTASWVNETEKLQKDLSLLNKLDVNLGVRAGRKFTITAGPSLNFWLSEWQDAETGEYLTQLAPYTLSEAIIGTTLTQMWVGGKVAVHW